MMMKDGMARFLAILVLLIFADTVGIVEAGSRSDLEEIDDFEHYTDTRRFELNASDDMSVARLQVKVEAGKGDVTWTLTDPAGEVRLNGEATGGRVKTDTGELEPIDGVWVLEMRFKKATGKYRFTWYAH